MTSLRQLLPSTFLLCASTVVLFACGDSGDGAGGGNTTSSDTDASTGSSGVCILHNCREDAHCEGCADGRNFCHIDAGEEYGRCVACGDGTTNGCPEGQECSSYGDCVPIGQSCETDSMGTPTISCQSAGDCAACDPAHQVCDTNTHKCVACTDNDTSECQSTDICKDGACAPACASDCQADNDCGKCGGAKACNNHKCSECSTTYACASGEACDLKTGTCQKICGKVDAPGTCSSDTDCSGCGAMQTTCHQPLNSSTGTCGPTATGCSDLGSGALALPPPYNQITNTCSSDDDCEASQAGIQYDVGQELIDLLGTDNIGGIVDIGHATVEYPMNACASISLQDTSCGVCVPCREDNDCQDIDLDGLSGDLFPGIGGAVLALVFDQVFGPNDHKLYMYCESVAAGYGVCVPCPGLINDCAPGGSTGGSGNCNHPPTSAGDALDPSCGTCENTICSYDSYCCDTEWDSQCVSEAASDCGGGGGACHDECDTGAAMGDECGSCAGDVCAEDSYCCSTSWDATCVAEAVDSCGISCN